MIGAVRRQFPNIPIIAISGGAEDLLAAAKTVGADAALEKPLDVKRLVHTVAALLK
jgi:CheY-like chemotaxis protein